MNARGDGWDYSDLNSEHNAEIEFLMIWDEAVTTV